MELEAYPSRVRGLGNVIVPKKEYDYVTHESIVMKTEEMYDGWEVYTMRISNSPVLIEVDNLEFNDDGTDMNMTVYFYETNPRKVYPNAKATVSIEGVTVDEKPDFIITADNTGKATINLSKLDVARGEYRELIIHHSTDLNHDSKYFHGWLMINIKAEYTHEGNIIAFESGNASLSNVKVILYNMDKEVKEVYFSDENGTINMKEYETTDTYDIIKEGYFFIAK